MTELDKIRAMLVERRAEWADKVHVSRHNFDLVEAELAAHDRAVAAMGGRPGPTARSRQSIQGPVMALFEDGFDRTETAVVVQTGLPETAVHKFLARGVKSGTLVLHDGVYRLPAKPLSETAK